MTAGTTTDIYQRNRRHIGVSDWRQVMTPIYTTEPNQHERSFAVVVVTQGDQYGLNDCLTHDRPGPMVEFYDTKSAGKDGFAPHGQFVSRYNLTALLGVDDWSRISYGKDHSGLDLCGHVSCWYVERDELRAALSAVVKRLGHLAGDS